MRALRARDTRLSHGAFYGAFYKSCPGLRIPRNFHLTGRGNSTAELEFPVLGG